MEKKSKLQSLVGMFLLCTAAIIWGGSFVAQKVGSGVVEPFTFIGIRTLIGGIVLIPVILIMQKNEKRKADYVRPNIGVALKWSIPCGVFLCLATVLQQFGIEHTTAGKSAFITALYVLVIPILSSIFFKKRIKWNIWLGVGLTIIGLYFLCLFGAESFKFSKGDAITLGCPFLFAFQMMTIERSSGKVNPVILSCIQFLTAGTIAIICAFIFEKIDINAVLSIAPAILYSGVLSCGVAYTFQSIAQNKVEASAASIILSAESVFAVLFGALLLKENIGINEGLGCTFILSAIIISQLVFTKKSSKQNRRI